MEFELHKILMLVVIYGGKRPPCLLDLVSRNSPQVDLVSCTRHADPEIPLGHMLNQHYLDPMFPLVEGRKQAAKEKPGMKWKSEREIAGRSEESVGDSFDEPFLGRIVTPDEKLAMRRDFTKIFEMGAVRRESGLEFGSGQVLKDTYGLNNCKDAKGDECLTFKRTASDRVVAEEARGKTVKDLSRLWKYLGGNSPMDRNYSEDGYPGELPHEHRKNRHDHNNSGKADQVSGDGPLLELQKTRTSLVFEPPHSSFPHPSPTSDEQSFYVSSLSKSILRECSGDLSWVGHSLEAHPLS